MEPIEYLEFEIEVGQGRDGEYPVSAASAAGQVQETMRLPFDPQALGSELEALHAGLRAAQSPAEGGRRRKESAPEPQPHAFGQALFDALFRGEVRALYHASRYQAAQEEKLLRLKLRIEPQELAPLPWESLYDTQYAGYVCHVTPVVRAVASAQSVPSAIDTPPLRILGMIVQPGGGPPPAAEVERQRLEEATSRLRALELVELEWVEGQSARSLVQALDRKEWHVLHLIGDGGLERNTGEGFVVVDDDAGQSRRLTATQLRWLLAKCKSLQLVWLSACAAAQGDRADRFTGTATLLVQKGIPAVLSAQLGANSPAAELFAEAFYAALAASMPLDLAVTKGRMAVQMDGGGAPSWGAPVLHASTPDLRLFERQAVMVTAQRRGDEALAGDEFERALTQYELAVEMGADALVQENRDLAEAVSQTVRAAEEALNAPAAKVEAQIDALMQSIGDLERVEERLPASPTIQALLRRARGELPGLRDRLWLEGEELLEAKAIGLTLDQRYRRMEDSVRLLEKAGRLTGEENAPLEEALSKARRRLDYLQSAKARAKAERGRRMIVYGVIIVVAIASLVALYLLLRAIPLSELFGRAPAAIPAPATVTVALTAAVVAASPTPGATATAIPAPTTIAPTLTPSPRPTDRPTATRTPSPEPTATKAPTATPLPSETAAPTPRPVEPSDTPEPTATETPWILYAAPVLLEPDNYASLAQAGGSEYSLSWTWDGVLRPGEWFDVRVWAPGMPHYGIAWTREPVFRFDLCLLVSGTYHWSIAVVRGEEGVWLGDLSLEATPRLFYISRSDSWCQLRGF